MVRKSSVSRNIKTFIKACLITVVSGAAFPQIALADDDTTAAADKFDFDHVSCRGGPFEIRVIIEGVKKNEGLMTADLYPNNEELFLKGRGRVKLARYAAKAPATKFCVTAPGPGFFAIAVYHDRNANTDFDKTGMGLPDEPWGISNNPRALFGPPPVEKALFQVTEEGAALAIKLN